MAPFYHQSLICDSVLTNKAFIASSKGFNRSRNSILDHLALIEGRKIIQTSDTLALNLKIVGVFSTTALGLINPLLPTPQDLLQKFLQGYLDKQNLSEEAFGRSFKDSKLNLYYRNF